MKLPKLELPLRTALLYLLFGGLWILLSDRILFLIVFEDEQQAMYETVKGWFFILVSGFLLYLVLLTDHAGRKRAEEALSTSQAQMTAIFNSAMDAIISTDTDQHIVIFNPAAEAMFRCTQAEAIGQPLERFIPQRFRVSHTNRVQSFAQTGATNRTMSHLGTIYGLRSDGEEFPIEASISKTNLAGHNLYTAILRDITRRKQAEAEILSLSRFTGENPSPVLRVSQDGMILYANPASEDLLKTWKRNVGQSVTAEWNDYINQALEAGRKEEVEIEAHGKFYSCTLNPVQSAGYINIYCHDITERKLAETELSASEERFRLLFENNHTAMMLIEPESGAIVNANAAAAAFYGYPLSELCIMNINEINQLTPDEVYAERLHALKEERTYFNFQHRLANGEIRQVEVHSAPVEVDGNTLLFSIIHDITDRKQAEEQIERQLQQLNALRMIDRAISSSFDLSTVLNVVLQEVVSQLGVDASAVLLFNSQTQTIEYAARRGFHSDALHYTNLRLGEGHAGRALLERKTIHITNLPHTGSKLAKALQLEHESFVDYYGTPLLVKGEVKGVLEIYHRSRLRTDAQWLEFLEALAGQAAIAIENARLWEQVQRHASDLELRVAERTADLNRINAELEHANRVKDEFLANMSHELRTPLNSIMGLSEVLLEQRGDPLSERQHRSLRIIESSGRHLLELINDVLDLSKIEAGKLDYYPQRVDVEALCRSSISFVKSQAARKSIAINYNGASVSEITADPRRLKQILVNLLTNAVKFTPEQGQVSLQAQADAERDLIKFSVLDNGIGIAPEDLRRLFQPFVQVDSKLNRQFEGTGLGLALVQKLTDLHGGSVEVESEVGLGSRFTINLPWEKEKVTEQEILESDGKPLNAERVEKPAPTSEDNQYRGTVLLAEDNMANILSIGDYLASHAYKIVTAHDGLEAIEKAEESGPDIILMDIQMPALDGLEATRRLRANPRFTTTPIIALTALAMPGDRERCLEAGANEYISKPVSLKRLAQTIREQLGQEARAKG